MRHIEFFTNLHRQSNTFMIGGLFIESNLFILESLKPGNILLTGNGDVKLSDFGLSKIFSDKNKQFMKGCAGT